MINWRWYGSSGHVAAPKGSVLEAFTACQPQLHDHIKTLVNLDYVGTTSQNSHAFLYKKGFFAGGAWGG